MKPLTNPKIEATDEQKKYLVENWGKVHFEDMAKELGVSVSKIYSWKSELKIANKKRENNKVRDDGYYFDWKRNYWPLNGKI